MRKTKLSKVAQPGELCTWVNPYCPNDLCVLPYGHLFSAWNRHITGSMYGSANTTEDEQIALLRDIEQTGWLGEGHYLAPRGTPAEELVRLGYKAAERLFLDAD